MPSDRGSPLTISDGAAEAVIVPDLGAGLAAYDLLSPSGRMPLFRPCRDLARAGPFDLALNLLVPWSNRISGGGFPFNGRFHPLAANVAGERYPIHGNGFSSRWRVERAMAAGDNARSCLTAPARSGTKRAQPMR